MCINQNIYYFDILLLHLYDNYVVLTDRKFCYFLLYIELIKIIFLVCEIIKIYFTNVLHKMRCTNNMTFCGVGYISIKFYLIKYQKMNGTYICLFNSVHKCFKLYIHTNTIDKLLRQRGCWRCFNNYVRTVSEGERD